MTKVAILGAKGNTKVSTFLPLFKDQIDLNFDHPRPQSFSWSLNNGYKPQNLNFGVSQNPKLVLLQLKIFTNFCKNFHHQKFYA